MKTFRLFLLSILLVVFCISDTPCQVTSTPGTTGAGTGDVTGPAGAVAGNFPALDATGKVLSDSGSAPADFAPAGTPVNPSAAEVGQVHNDTVGSFHNRILTLETDLGDGTNLNAVAIAVTDDTTTNATMYPLWVTAATGTLPAKLSSSKLTYNPSTNTFSLVSGTLSTLNATAQYVNCTVNLNNYVNNMTTTSTDGTTIGANNAATAIIPVRMSPRLKLEGRAWNTTTSASKTNSWILECLPTSGATTSSILRIGNMADGAASHTYLIDITQAGKFSGLPTTNGPTGTCTLAGTGNTTTVVNNTCVTANSRIFLMPTSATAASAVGSATGVWISAKTADTSFTITHPDTADNDRTFDYWIVN